MAGQGFGVAHVDHPLEEAERIKALPAALVAAFHSKSQQRAEVRAQIPMRHRIERIVGKADIVDPIDHGMSAQKFRDLACVLYVALHAEGQALNSLQKEKSVKWRERGAGISLADGAAARDKSGIPVMVDIDHAV